MTTTNEGGMLIRAGLCPLPLTNRSTTLSQHLKIDNAGFMG